MKSNFEFLRERWPELADVGSQAEAFSHVDFDKCFECLEETEMYEIKQGPYAGEADKTRFEAVNENGIKVVSENTL